ncbi:MAG: ribosome maturation factor RimP [Cellvibrionaceae bacterium]
MSTRQQVLHDLISPVVEALGCELWGLEYLSQGKHTLVRIYIDKESGVGLEDCEKVSRQVSSLMDVEDPITGKYTLEVSSPGMDRPLYTLEHFKRFVGETVAVKLSRAFEQRKKIQGVLTAVENDEVIIQLEDEEYVLPIELVEKANIVPRF